MCPNMKPLIEKIRQIPPPQYREREILFQKIKSGDKTAKNRLVEMYLRNALHIALEAAEISSQPLEDIFPETVIGLIERLDCTATYKNYSAFISAGMRIKAYNYVRKNDVKFMSYEDYCEKIKGKYYDGERLMIRRLYLEQLHETLSEVLFINLTDREKRVLNLRFGLGDHDILVQNSVKDKLIKQITKSIREMYGKDVLANEEYPKMINEKHFDRVVGLMEKAHIVIGGESDRTSRKIVPTVLDQVTWESPVMQEEIFGPLLPVLTFYDMKEAIQMVNARPRPLALYYFTKDKKREAKILKHISYGGGCINDTVVHLATSHMPFGGVGNSGMGGYHGKDSFETFSHRKSIMKKSLLVDIPIRYAPFKNKLALLKKIQ